LLDEPGLHLHIRAQQKLLAFFQKVSGKNQLVYTSHSPFMVDPDELDNVRTVFLKKDEDGDRFHTCVATGTEPGGDRDTVLPLQAALGYELAQTLFLGKKTLVVEGFSDYMLLKYLSHELRIAGKACLADDVVVIFAGGTSHILPLVALFSRPDQEDRRLVVMLDADKPGQEKAKQLRRDLLSRDGAVALLSEPDLLGFADAEIEDIADRTELVSALHALKGQQVVMPNPAPPTNVAFLRAVYTANGWDALSHAEKAGLVLAVIDSWRTGNKPTAATVANAERVFQGLAARLQ
jgi:predicted ATP-dependent endonuclease of OLD family